MAGTENFTKGGLDSVRENEAKKGSSWDLRLELDKNMFESSRLNAFGAGWRIAIEVATSLDLLITPCAL